MIYSVEIRTDGPNGPAYPAVQAGPYEVDRKHGSWLLRCGDKSFEPDVAGIDPEDLQSLPEVKQFDRECKAALLASATVVNVGAEYR